MSVMRGALQRERYDALLRFLFALGLTSSDWISEFTTPTSGAVAVKRSDAQ